MSTVINLSGVQFTNPTKLGLVEGDKVTVKHHKQYDDNELALGVHNEGGGLVGWIPKTETCQKYYEKEIEAGNEPKAMMQKERKAIASALRDALTVDLFRNHLAVEGKITRLQQDYQTGEVLSVSVAFDYM